MTFRMTHKDGLGEAEVFTEDTAPDWLKIGGKEGSTMCNRWFWNDHVMTLAVGETVDTDFRTIKRIE